MGDTNSTYPLADMISEGKSKEGQGLWGKCLSVQQEKGNVDHDSGKRDEQLAMEFELIHQRESTFS